jgi:hypothetical protein
VADFGCPVNVKTKSIESIAVERVDERDESALEICNEFILAIADHGCLSPFRGIIW